MNNYGSPIIARLQKIFRNQLPIISGIVGSGGSVVLTIIATPVYIGLLGIEAYGLISFYVTLQSAFQLFDAGITPTVTRELARFSDRDDDAIRSRELMRSLELIYWAIGLVLSVGLLAIAPTLSIGWLSAQNLSNSSLQFAVYCMGVLFFLQWPLSFYQGVLYGLQRQALSNLIVLLANVFRTLLTIVVLLVYERTIEAFFLLQISIAALQLAVAVFVTWRSMPRSDRAPGFRISLVKSVWRYSAITGSINILGLLLIQLDKLILSRLLNLEKFGYYMLAISVARSVSVLPAAIQNYAFSRFSRTTASNDVPGLRFAFHNSAQWICIVSWPITAVLLFDSHALVVGWTRSNVVADQVAPIVLLLAIGNALNNLVIPCYSLNIAVGHARSWLYLTLGLVIIVVPVLFLLTPYYGVVGAASVWIGVNIIQLVVGIPLATQRYLRSELKKWLILDNLIPAIVGSVIVAIFHFVAKGDDNLNALAMMFVALALATLMSFVSIRSVEWIGRRSLSRLQTPEVDRVS